MSTKISFKIGIALTRMTHGLTSSWRAKVEHLQKSASACSFSQIAARMEPSAALRTNRVTRLATIIIIEKMMQSARFA